MEFWGVEVKAGERAKVEPEFGSLVHISQASLGEVKDAYGAKNVPLRLNIDNNDFVIGSLAAEHNPQMMLDLVFEKEFKLSHDWKHGSVFFMGYIAENPVSDFDDSEHESEDERLAKQVDAKPKAGAVKVRNGTLPAAATAKAVIQPEKKKSDSDDNDEDGSENDSDDDSDDDDMALDVSSLGADSSDDESGEDSDKEDDDDSSEEEEPTPKQSKKRTAQQAPLAAAKKAKSSAPDTTGKKCLHMTPTPTGKDTANKSKQSPKSGGQFHGKSGNKFNSKNGKGKRGGK